MLRHLASRHRSVTCPPEPPIAVPLPPTRAAPPAPPCPFAFFPATCPPGTPTAQPSPPTWALPPSPPFAAATSFFPTRGGATTNRKAPKKAPITALTSH